MESKIIQHVKDEIKSLYSFINQEKIYVQTKITDGKFKWIGVTQATNSEQFKGEEKIYLYCTCCSILKPSVKEAIDKNDFLWKNLRFCDTCNERWVDLCNYCHNNRLNIYDYCKEVDSYDVF